MAETEDVVSSSDVVHDFPCTPCSDDGRNTEGVSFCAECQAYFCPICLGHHNKCLKNHTMFNKSSLKSGKIQHQQQQTAASALSCEKHPGYGIHMYCAEHDVVSCAICIAMDHRLCKGVDYIPKLTKEVLNGRDRNDVKTSLEQLCKDLNKIKFSKLAEQSKVNTAKEELLAEIKFVNKRIVARAKEMEQMSIEQVEETHKGIVDKINRDIEDVDTMMKTIERQVEMINLFKGENEAKLFVLLNKGHELESGCMNIIENDCKAIYDKLAFDFNTEIETFLNDRESFGYSTVDIDHSIMSTSMASLIGEYDVMVKDETMNPNVVDTCMLDDGGIVITDFSNNRLKRFDRTFHLTDWCTVSGPRGVSRSGPQELAIISMYNNVQFVHVGKTMLSTRSFTIDKKHGVYPSEKGHTLTDLDTDGIACNNEKLFISTQLVYSKVTDRYKHLRVYAVLVYDVKGSHLRTIHADQNGENAFSEIHHISPSPDGSCLYIADLKNGLITVDLLNGQKVSQITDERLRGAHDVAVGDNGQLFVCGRDSHNIFLVNKHSHIVEEILGNCDGIITPQSVTYLRHPRRLVVTSHSKIQVFKLT